MQVERYHPSSAKADNSILSVDISQGGTVACGIDHGVVDVLELSNKQTIRTLPPPNWVEDQSDYGCNSVIFANGSQHVLYCNDDRRIFKYDLRQQNPLCSSFDYNKEEINQIAVNCTESHLAACDDAGFIVVIDLRNGAVYMDKCCHDSICSCVQFLPNQPFKLISAGMDCKLNYYDIDSEENPTVLQTININDISPSESNHATMVNPPFIHHLDVAWNSNRIACATNDSNIYVFETDYEEDELVHTQCLSGHSLCANQSHFTRWQSTNYLVSAGNDGKLMLWDLLSDGSDENEDEECEYPAPVVIDHKCKVNWIASSDAPSQIIMVSDLSPSITLYSNIGCPS
ncbi:uncharacterized protein TRIADDRAFT_55956 [Trichoplax adhaerens]|uniref:Uncharacterized protein n=1 Tax=Trichoplax adhaerens TaxID=10228 RepID=B3RTK4_TRIAD|nr:hypothetical protein TRIADDRAFT_55956 [Trichoplax adhaerens]EDV26145.1 hypothetical protein TRIADDRAFT_55956 [Trichoplax adhaerens]|eukprot:XP_002112178.1 hypothetical protein TRIADDRAFT_55956 [Trichoplax adhaerens]